MAICESKLDSLTLDTWVTTYEQALETHESYDKKQLKKPVEANDVQTLLVDYNVLRSERLRQSATAIAPSLHQFQILNKFLESKFGAHPILNSTFACLHFAIKLLSQSSSALQNLARITKRFSQKVELFNEHCKTGNKPSQTAIAGVDIHTELTAFFVHLIGFYRHRQKYEGPAPGARAYTDGRFHERELEPLTQRYNRAVQSIEDTFQTIERLSRLADMVSKREDLESQVSLISLSNASKDFKDDVHVPCYMMPAAKDGPVFDRTDLCKRVQNFLHPPGSERVFRSLLLYGYAGVGKTHVALKYAQLQATTRSLDVILWLRAETITTLKQSITEAVTTLQLPGVGEDRREENRIILLNWLQQTEHSWLLVFDNVDHGKGDLLLKHWPSACSSGSIIITSRDHMLRFGPADDGFEVDSFDPDHGSRLLYHLLRMDIAHEISTSEAESALELSKEMSGHALGLSVVAGLIQKGEWTIQDFLQEYNKKPNSVHDHKSQHPTELSIIWRWSFQTLDKRSSTLLGLLTYMEPDLIDEKLFKFVDSDDLSKSLATCLEEVHHSVQPLLTMALVKRDKVSKTLSLHRLVQKQHRYYMSSGQRQEAFTHATELLFKAFPRVKSQLYHKWQLCEMCLRHVMALKDNYKAEMKEEVRIQAPIEFIQLLSDCSRYLIETAAYVELEDVLSVARSSYDILPLSNRNESILAEILDATGLLWGHRGQFHKAEISLREAYTIRSEQETKDWLNLSWVQVDLGNVVASLCRYNEALDLELEGKKTREKMTEEDDLEGSSSVLLQNIGRCYTFLNIWTDAGKNLDEALRVTIKSSNWAMFAFTLFARGNLERRQKQFHSAKKSYEEAIRSWVAGGGLKTHHFDGACHYKLGCVANDLGELSESIKFLEDALVITKLKKDVMPGDHARVLHKLGVVLNRCEGREVEASERIMEANQVLHSQSPKDESLEFEDWSLIPRPSSSDYPKNQDSFRSQEMEEYFDNLVYILWR